jgi:mono/diheme cytochrome c family protein
MKRNLFAAITVLLVLIGLPAGLFGYQAWRTGHLAGASGVRVIDIVAQSPQQGGFAPDHLVLKAGEPVRLRISSTDVVHGLNIPGLGVDVKEILPGKVVEVDFKPEKPGRYAFACTRWCSVDHWRMRGVIEVVPDVAGRADAAQPAGQETQTVPLYQKLGLNLDAAWPMDGPRPAGTPSAERAAAASVGLPESLLDPSRRVAITPADAFSRLRAEPTHSQLSDGDIWDQVAWAWLHDAKPESLAAAASLYSRDCAACHGPEGKGDGPAGRSLPGLQKMNAAGGDTAGRAAASLPAGPADFTDPARMLNASDAVLQGKILRGGMGTGMPEFGSLYTDDEMWAMVQYIRTFLFQPLDK